MQATQENKITDIKAFFESDTWKTDIAERIIKDLGKALPCSNLIKNRYGFDIPTTMLMKKAKELQDLKPKREMPKIKGKLKFLKSGKNKCLD